MATKTISLDEDSYNRLKSLKEGDESFSDVVKKVTSERSLMDIAGILSDEEADELRENIEKSREKAAERSKEISEKI